MAGEFIKDNLEKLINSVATRSSGSFDDDRYSNLESSKDAFTNLTDKDKNVVDIIKSTELVGIFKKINALDNITDVPQKLISAEGVVDNLFDVISDLNTDLLMSDENSPEYQKTLQSLAVAFYMYEQILYPLLKVLNANQNSKDADTKKEKSLDDMSANEWVEFQEKEFIKKKVGFETRLRFQKYEKKLIPTEKQRDIEEEFVELFIQMSTDAQIKKEMLEREIEQLEIKKSSDPTKTQEIESKIVELQNEQKKYDDFGTELVNKIELFLNEWGLNEYKKKKESRDVDQMSEGEVVDYVIERELKFWEDLDVNSDDEFVRKLIKKLKWEMGWEDNSVREGTCGGYWASLEGRENMVRLQIFAVQAWVLRGKPFAEGDRSKLFEALDKFKISREQLILATTANPVIGRYLSKVLEICQDLPILRTGKLPKRELWGTNGINVDKTIERGYEKDENGNVIKDKDGNPKIKPLNDRVVKRFNKKKGVYEKIFLKGDVWQGGDNENPNLETVFFSNGEPMQPGDKLYLEADKDFNYASLSGNLGKEVAKSMHHKVMEAIEGDPARYGLEQADIPEAQDKKELVYFYTQMLFYSFPFLTYILAKSQERTQTASHNKDLEEKFDWILVFSPLGKAIHDSERYGDFVSWMWLLIYYKELESGKFGAAGDVKRLNDFRNLLIAHQRALFGDAIDSVINQIDIHETFGESEMLSPYKMLTLAPKEFVRLMGASGLAEEKDESGKRKENNLKDDTKWEELTDKERTEWLQKKSKDEWCGKEIKGTVDEPYLLDMDGKKVNKKGRHEAYSFDLMLVAVSGWLKLLKGIVEGIPPGSVTSETLKGKGEKKGDVGDLLGIIAGTIKMYETESATLPGYDVLEGFTKYPLFHKILRLFHAARSNDIDGRRKMFQALENQLLLAATRGGLNSGHAQKMTLWVLDQIRGRDGKRYGRNAFTGYEGMNIGLAPRETLANSKRKHDVIEYLRLLWEWKSKDSKGNETLGEFPLSENVDSKFGFIKPHIWINPVLRKNPDVIYFSQMALRETALEAPLGREGLETHSSKESKEK